MPVGGHQLQTYLLIRMNILHQRINRIPESGERKYRKPAVDHTTGHMQEMGS